MNVSELQSLVGHPGTWLAPNGMKVPVDVLDARVAYGRTDVLVRPVGGSDEQWVDAKSVTIGGEQ